MLYKSTGIDMIVAVRSDGLHVIVANLCNNHTSPHPDNKTQWVHEREKMYKEEDMVERDTERSNNQHSVSREQLVDKEWIENRSRTLDS